MGTPGHMQHPFDIPEVRTGNDLVSYFNKIVEYVTQNPPSIKFDGINVSFKLVQNRDGSRDFRMDRGTSHTESVIGMTARDAYDKWPPGHGMPPAIEDLLNIFNKSLPLIEPELKKLGMWDDPTKFFNTEYMKKGKTNVIEYPEPIVAVHGINQFYQKKAQSWRVAKGDSMDRPGLPRPIDSDTKKPVKHGSTEITYDKTALQSIIEKVAPIARQLKSANAPNGYAMVGDVPANLVGDIDFSEALNISFPVTVSEGRVDERTLGQWLEVAINPAAPPSPDLVTLSTGKTIWAHSKDVYVNVLNKVPLDQYLANPEEDSEKAISGAVFNHATRMLGNVVKSAFDSQFGNVYDHEGLVIRGLEFRPLKVTGDFVLDSLATTFRDPVNEVIARTVNAIRNKLTLSADKEKALLRKIMGTKESVSFIGKGLNLEQKRHVADLLINSESITGERIYVIEQESEKDFSKVELGEFSTIALVPGGFKPPHIGHFEMVRSFASKADMVYIIMGSGGKTPRTINGNRVTYEMSSTIWEMYMQDAGIENYTLVEVEEGEKSRVSGHKASPMQIAYDIMQLDTKPKQTVIMGASTKDAGRFSQYAEKYVPKDEEGNPKINLEVEEFPAYTISGLGPNSETIDASASIMRDMIERNDFDSFKQLLPETSRKRADEIWNTLSGDATEMKEKKTFGTSQLFSLVEEAMDKRADLLLEKNYAGVTGKRFYTDPKNWKVPRDESEAVRLAIDISDEELGARSGFEKFAGRLKGFMPGRASYTGQSSEDHDQMQKAIYDELLALRAQFSDREYQRHRRAQELDQAKTQARAEVDAEFERDASVKRSIAQDEYERDLKGRQAQADADRKKEYYKKYPGRVGKVPKRNKWGVTTYVSPDEAPLGIDEKKMTKGDKNRDTRLKKKMDKDPSIKKDFKKRYGKDGESVYFATIRKQAMKKDEEIELDEAELEEISAAGAGGGSVEGGSGKNMKRNRLIRTN